MHEDREKGLEPLKNWDFTSLHSFSLHINLDLCYILPDVMIVTIISYISIVKN